MATNGDHAGRPPGVCRAWRPRTARTRSARRGLLRGWAPGTRPPNNHRRMRRRREVGAGKDSPPWSRSLPRPHPLADAHGTPRVDLSRSPSNRSSGRSAPAEGSPDVLAWPRDSQMRVAARGGRQPLPGRSATTPPGLAGFPGACPAVRSVRYPASIWGERQIEHP